MKARIQTGALPAVGWSGLLGLVFLPACQLELAREYMLNLPHRLRVNVWKYPMKSLVKLLPTIIKVGNADGRIV